MNSTLIPSPHASMVFVGPGDYGEIGEHYVVRIAPVVCPPGRFVLIAIMRQPQSKTIADRLAKRCCLTLTSCFTNTDLRGYECDPTSRAGPRFVLLAGGYRRRTHATIPEE